MATQLATTEQHQLSAQTEEGRFALRQRQARMFAMSPLIPEHLRKGTPEQAMANCYIALTLAEAMGEVPLIVMQNIHVVSGKAGFASQYMIARANSSGVFRGRIDWRIDRSDPANLAVTAFAIIKETGDEVSVCCDMKMAKAEGWTKNPKYTSMPEVMLRYRSAAFLVRFYAPDVMLGYQTVEEVQDVAMAVEPAAPLSAAMLAAPVDEPHDAETGEVIQQGQADYVAASTHGRINGIPDAGEGPADEQRGEATHPAQDAAADLCARADAASTIIDLNKVRADADQHREAIEAYDMTLMAGVDLACDDAEVRLRGA